MIAPKSLHDHKSIRDHGVARCRVALACRPTGPGGLRALLI
jgi:hypothetical protein